FEQRVGRYELRDGGALQTADIRQIGSWILDPERTDHAILEGHHCRAHRRKLERAELTSVEVGHRCGQGRQIEVREGRVCDRTGDETTGSGGNRLPERAL